LAARHPEQIDHRIARNERAIAESRAVVTENVGQDAPEPDLVSVGVLERTLPSGGAQARALAAPPDRWGEGPERAGRRRLPRRAT